MKKEEELPPFNFPIEDKSERIIKVIGVGGGGGNAVQHMWEEGVKNVSFLVTNTDSQVLKANLVPNKMQIGPGLGTGGIPELGREMAEASIEEIRAMFGEETKMVFITAGMGGGTGTGAAPVIARVAKEMGILTVGVVTLPFKMEMRKRMDKALLGMETVMKDGGAALVSVAKASGEKRIFKALSEAISSPLVANVEKQKVRRLLYIVYSGNQNPARMDELEEISEFMENFDENLDVLWGHYPDETLGDEIKVAVVATGFDQNDGEEGTDVNLAKQDEMKRLKDLREKFYTHAHAASKEDEMPEETCVPIVEQPPVIEHDNDEPEEEDTEEREDATPKTPTFVEILFGKMKKLMEEE